MLAARLRAGESVTGTMIRLARTPAILPIAKQAGFDFVMMDLEHGPGGFETIGDLAVAARALKLGFLLRVPELARGYVSRALDCGVDGVMVPMLETPEQACQLVAWGKYPPVGGRGLSSVGGHTDYRSVGDVVRLMADANRDTLLIAQMETATAVANARTIAATPGIDVLLVGPNDLAVSLGYPGRLDTPEEDAAIETIAAAARDHGKIFAMHAGAPMLARWADRGMRLFMSGIDTNAMADGLATLATETRRVAIG